MKNLMRIPGGYQRLMDFTLLLQDELLAATNALFGSISFDVILQGCAITNNNNGTVDIAPGIVYIGGEVMRFDGAAGIAVDGTQALVKGNPVTSFPVKFNDTQATKNVCSEAKAVVAPLAPGNARQLVVSLSMLTFEGYIDARIAGAATKGEIKEFSFGTAAESGAFLSNFDASGLGTTPRWIGWAIMNGNNGTQDAQLSVFVGHGSAFDNNTGIELTANPGDTGGEFSHKLTVNEGPKPSGTPTGFDGPHKKPGDGGGQNEYYVTSWSTGSDAQQAHSIMQKWLAVVRVQKIN